MDLCTCRYKWLIMKQDIKLREMVIGRGCFKQKVWHPAFRSLRIIYCLRILSVEVKIHLPFLREWGDRIWNCFCHACLIFTRFGSMYPQHVKEVVQNDPMRLVFKKCICLNDSKRSSNLLVHSPKWAQVKPGAGVSSRCPVWEGEAEALAASSSTVL